ncbi:MAG: DUF4214 domain-containing protein [Halomonas sp.]|uniref:DUF4214 domain-containing protein n=1 Tax=Halomonas sp. TaxID=1486246 RepID=UPI003F923372
MATSQESLNQAQLLYVAYYGRPADPEGLQYWAGVIEANGIDSVMNTFGTSAEFDDMFGGLSSSQLINNLYEQLFNRSADLPGLQFYTGVLNSGSKTLAEIAYEIANGAQNDDKVALDNKLAVADEFTAGLSTTEAVLAYQGNAASEAGRDFLATIDQNTVVADVDVGSVIGSLVSAPVVGEDYVLTTGQDILTGTPDNDTFFATQATLQNGDSLNGAGGDDTLDLSVAQGVGAFVTAPTLSNIEKIQVNGPNLLGSDSITFDLSNSDGYNTLESYQTTQGGLPSAAQDQSATLATATVTFRDIQNVNGTDLRIIDTNLNHTLSYDTNAYESLLGGDDDVVDLYLQEVDGSTITLQNVTGIQNTPGGALRSHVDQVNITSDERTQVNVTPDNYVWELNVGPVFNELFIDGNANLEIEKFLDEGVKLVDATELNADLALDLLGHGAITANRALIDPLVVLGAQGDDRIDVRGEFAGGQQVRGTNGAYTLGTGDDLLRVGNSSDEAYSAEQTIGHNMVDSGEGDDTVVLNATGLQDVTSGEGDDTVYINGDVDDLRTVVYGDGVSSVDTGAGNDTVYINGEVDDGQGIDPDDVDYASVNRGQGDYEISLGDGDDSLEMHVDGGHFDGNGDWVLGGQSIDAGAGDDTVWIEGDGVHDIDLGSGDDYLLIQGSRLAANNIDNASAGLPFEEWQTKIVAGEGDDVVVINGDHYLNVELNEGDDQLMLNADELTVDDVIDGGEGRDTLSLRNYTSGIVTTGISETSSVTSIEVFDLWDSGQVLKLSSDNFDTADNNHITVKTTNSFSNDLAFLTEDAELVDGEWVGGVRTDFDQGMSRAEYNDIRTKWANGDYDQYSGGAVTLEDWLIGKSPVFNPNPVDAVDFADGDASGDNNLYDETTDAYVASNDPAVDSVNFRTEPGTQTVDITDIPLSTVSGRSFTLEGGNIRDIVVADDASISHRLELNYDADSGTGDSIEDTLRVIDAATITAADLRNVSGLEIIELQASLNTAQTWDIELSDHVINQTTGTADLVIRVDPEVAAGSRVNIQLDPSTIDANKDVRIETNGNVDIYINGSQVTEPQYGTDLSLAGSTYTVTVTPALLFTTNADTLVGTAGNDTFVAASLDQVQQGDSVDGLGNRDTVQLNFALSNQLDSLMAQLENPSFTSIEEIKFETGNNVQIDGLGNVSGVGLDTVTTGYGDDTLTDMERGYTYNLRRGDDTLTLENRFGFGPNPVTFVDGGAGFDTVNGTTTGFFNTGIDLLDVTDVEEINLFGGNDVVTIAQNVDDGDITVNGGAGNDTTNIVGAIGGTVFANDVETVNDSGFGNTIVADGENNATVTVNGFGGDDDITVFDTTTANVNAGDGDDTVEVYDVTTATVNGGQGDDNLHVHDVNTATVNGGQGDDTILVEDVNASTVTGGGGNDDITALTVGAEVSTITGGAGDDEIALSGNVNGGQDTVMFGDVAYDALQQQNLNTQGNDTITNFNFENGGPGAEDVLDFTNFNGVTSANALVHHDWTSGPVPTGVFTGGVAVLEVNDGFVLDGVNASNLSIADNGVGVVIAGMDTDNDGGFDSFDVYYVQDIDSDTNGQVWAVDQVATIESITEIGVLNSIDLANIA